jgi:1,3-beta-glucan synthase
MLLFSTTTVWTAALIWFWVSLLALCISPFLFNPHQFAWNDFFIDYRDYIRWLSRGNSRSHASSWIGFCRLSRTRITGYKRKLLGVPSEKGNADIPRARITNIFFSEIVAPLVVVGATLIPYLYINSRTMFSDDPKWAANPIARVAIVAFAPVGINAGVAGMFFGMACCMGPLFGMCCKKFGAVLAAIAHAIAVIAFLIFFLAMFVLESLNWPRTISGMIAVMALQRFVYKLIISLALTREFKNDQSNIAWWTGKWYNMGWHSLSQPGREFLCKITELGYFANDFVLGHILLFAMLPALAIPYVDKFHSVILFWLRPRYVTQLTPFQNLILTKSSVGKSALPSTLSSSPSCARDVLFVSPFSTSSCSSFSL